MAQGLLPYDAACCGALMMGLAAQWVRENGAAEESVLPSDVIEGFRFVLAQRRNFVKQSLQFVF